MRPQSVKYLLMAQDMDRAVRFYSYTMGFAEGFLSPGWSELRSGDSIVALHEGGDGTRKQTGLSLQYEDVDQIYQAALSAGAQSVAPPQRQEGEPIKLATIADPEGNEIMLTEFMGHGG